LEWREIGAVMVIPMEIKGYLGRERERGKGPTRRVANVKGK